MSNDSTWNDASRGNAASSVSVDTTNLDKNLNGIAGNVQSQIEAIDELAIITSAERTKLDGIETGGQENVNSDWNAVSGDEEILNKPTTISAGQAAEITANTAAQHEHTNKSTIDLITDEGSGEVITVAERAKLAGVDTGAEVNVNADWDAVGGDEQILNKPTIPANIEDLGETATARYVSDAEKATFNGKADTDVATVSADGLMSSTDKTKLDGLLTTQAQADWNESVNTEPDYIKNKPTTISAGQAAEITANTAAQHSHTNKAIIDAVTDAGSGIVISGAERTKLSGVEAGAEVNVQSDWNASGTDAEILNKPTIPAAISDLSEDATARYVSDAEKSTWNGKAETTEATTLAAGLMSASDKTKLDGVGSSQTQSDWTEGDTGDDAYIKNKPTTITAQQASDITDNNTDRHTHSNKSTIDAITAEGSGSIITTAERNKLTAIETTAEVNAAANLGAGDGLYASKSGSSLQFKSLTAGSGVTLTDSANEVEIAATGEANTASNLGTGEGLYDSKSGVDLRLKSLTAGTGVTLTGNAADVEIATTAEANTASNVGTGDGEVYKEKSGVDLRMKTINAGTDITIVNNPDDITISSTAAIAASSWGSISGTLSDQTDLQNELTDKQGVLTEGSFVDGDKTKLDGIEAAADVTDATNVDAAGAVMATDNSLASTNFFLDEDDFASDDPNRVPSQQSVKAYISNNVSGALVLQGDWDANTNTPDISTETTTGYSWRVSVAGTTSLGGISSWGVNDWAVKTATGWSKIDNSSISGTWGGIGGTLSNQTDLQTELDAKQDEPSEGAFANGDKTKLDGITTAAEVNTASNVGTGDGEVFKQKTSSDLELKTIKAGANVTVTNNASDITIAATGGGGASYQVQSAAGATPADTDVSTWANDTHGVVVGTGGRVWFTFKNATDVYYVEAGAL